MAQQKTAQEWWPARVVLPQIDMLYPLDFEDDIRSALGLMIDRWSSLELRLHSALAIMLNGDGRAAFGILYSVNSISARVEIIRDVALNVLPEGKERDGFIFILNQVRRLAKTRNTFVHGVYQQHENGMFVSLPRGIENLDTQSAHKVTGSSIRNHCEAVELVTNRLILACAKDPAAYMQLLREGPSSRTHPNLNHATTTADI